MKSDLKLFYLPAALIILFSFYLQTRLFFSADVAFLLHAATDMWHGGNYTYNFFETNPPLILYLYLPGALISSFTKLPILTITRLYLFFLATGSLLTSFYLLRQQITNKPVLMGLFYMLIFVLFFLPGSEFGQREHLLLIFLLPYLLSCALYIEHKPLPLFARIAIGFFAGLGFALKPFFIPTLLLIELYVGIKYKNVFKIVRIETITIALTFFGYALLIFYRHLDYLQVILPLVNTFYFSGAFKESWFSIFFLHGYVTYSTVSLIICVILKKYAKNPILNNIFILALLGLIIAFLIPRSPWFYHIYPALALTCLALTLVIGDLISLPNKIFSYKGAAELSFLAGCVCMIFYIPILCNFYHIRYGIALKEKSSLNHIATLINQSSQKSILCFSANTTEDCFPLVYLPNFTYASRFPFFWWLPGLVNTLKSTTPTNSTLMDKYKFLTDAVTNDLIQYHPEFILINTEHAELKMGKDFSFQRFFSKNAQFSKEWTHYRLLTQISPYLIYKRI